MQRREREQLERALSPEFEVLAVAHPAEVFAALSAGAAYDLVLCSLEMTQPTGIEFFAELARERPDQAARLVFLHMPNLEQRARRLLDAIGVWHVNRNLPAHELLLQLGGLLQLWQALGLRNPRTPRERAG